MLVDIGSCYLNTDHIVSIKPAAGGQVATLITGTTVSIPSHADVLEAVCGTIVPAPQGLFLIEALPPGAGEADRTVHFRTTPVLAFRITAPRDAPVPIGGFGEPSSTLGGEYAVIHADGRCFGWEITWDSVADFMADQQAAADAQARPTAPATVPMVGRAPAAEPVQQIAPGPISAGSEAAPGSVEHLRATILTETVESVRDGAPWHPGRDFAEVIAEVRDAHPDLHTNGIGYRPAWGWKWGPGDQDRAREAMTSPGHVEEFERALRFLAHAGRRFPQARVNDKRTSYSWKHVAERVMGGYVSNGMLITAAYALGFKVATDDSPNPCINLGDKAASLDTHRRA